MDISQYVDFFHDGSIMDIRHVGNKIEFFMASAEMDEEDVKDDVVLSKDDTIRGKLHIEGVRNIKENNQQYLDILRMKCKTAEIFHFGINQNNVELQILWYSFPPKPCIDDFSTIEIEAEKIWWENIPNLPD